MSRSVDRQISLGSAQRGSHKRPTCAKAPRVKICALRRDVHVSRNTSATPRARADSRTHTFAASTSPYLEGQPTTSTSADDKMTNAKPTSAKLRNDKVKRSASRSVAYLMCGKQIRRSRADAQSPGMIRDRAKMSHFGVCSARSGCVFSPHARTHKSRPNDSSCSL